jgi:hypothetical protein
MAGAVPGTLAESVGAVEGVSAAKEAAVAHSVAPSHNNTVLRFMLSPCAQARAAPRGARYGHIDINSKTGKGNQAPDLITPPRAWLSAVGGIAKAPPEARAAP